MPPKAVYFGMAHRAAADPSTDDLGALFPTADSSGRDLLVAAARELQVRTEGDPHPPRRISSSATPRQAQLTLHWQGPAPMSTRGRSPFLPSRRRATLTWSTTRGWPRRQCASGDPG
eukprot:10212436-Alexandrium_andersonii.AAC.1